MIIKFNWEQQVELFGYQDEFKVRRETWRSNAEAAQKRILSEKQGANPSKKNSEGFIEKNVWNWINAGNERRKMKIYAFDFDGTLVREEWPAIGKQIEHMIKFCKWIQKQPDTRWILLTMREGPLLQEAIDFLAGIGLHPDAVNDNLPERVAEWGGSNPRKVYADFYIDDHNYIGYLRWEDFGIKFPEDLRGKK